MWKWVLLVVAALGVSCIGGGVYLVASGKLAEFGQQLKGDNKPVAVRLEKPKRGDLVRTVNAPGNIESKTKVDISAQVSARIIALPFREGQAVKKDEVVVRLESQDLQAQLDSAEASLLSEKARLVGAKSRMDTEEIELGRKRNLLDTKDLSQSEFDAAKAQYEQAVSSYEQVKQAIKIAEANIQRAKKDLANAVISAPFDGVITSLNAEVGELVVVGTLNNAGSVIMRLSDMSQMIMRAKIDESNIAPVKPGQTCRVYMNAFPDKVFGGKVERVRPTRQIDKDGTAYFETEILVDLPADNTLSGMLANVEVEVETLHDVLKVPSQAVVDRPIDELPSEVTRGNDAIDQTKKYSRVVYRLIDGLAVPTPVRVGISDLTESVIVQGLSENDQIVTGPYRAILAMKNNQKIIDEVEQAKLDKEKGKTEAGDKKKGGG